MFILTGISNALHIRGGCMSMTLVNFHALQNCTLICLAHLVVFLCGIKEK